MGYPEGQLFLLMHKDVIAANLCLSEDGSMLHYKVEDKEHFPIVKSDKEFRSWWERRAVPLHQKELRALLDNNTPLVYMVKNLGLSLTDGYWIKPFASPLQWEDVNLYSNEFLEKEFRYSNATNPLTNFLPSATTQGELQKRWVIDESGTRCLIKGNYGNSFQQSMNEVFASIVHEKQGRLCTPYIPYKNIPMELGGGFGCLCENFTSEDVEFIPAYDVANSIRQPNNVSAYEHYINACVAMGLDRDYIQDNLDYMILSDFILTNTDRHYLNFGILRDSNTLKAVCAAPYFDTGNAMGFNKSLYVGMPIDNIPATSLYPTEWELLKHVTDYNALDVSKLPKPNELDAIYADDPYSIVYLSAMKDLYQRKIQVLTDIQIGKLNPKSKSAWLAYHGKDARYSAMRHCRRDGYDDR